TVIAGWHSVAYNSGSTAHGNGSASVQSSIWDIFPVVSVGRQPAGNANPDRSVVITGQRTTTGEVYRKISRDDRCAVDADKAYFLGSVEHLDLRKVSRKFYRSIGTRRADHVEADFKDYRAIGDRDSAEGCIQPANGQGIGGGNRAEKQVG